MEYPLTVLALFNMFYENLCNRSMLGEGHQSEWMRYQNTLKAYVRMYLSSQNYTHITNIHYRTL